MSSLVTYDEALRRMFDIAVPIGTERAPLGRAGRRRLATPVKALVNSPASDLSAMDGYAVINADEQRWRIAGATFAGDDQPPPLGKGECRYVTTGAKVPDNCTSVIPIELVQTDSDIVSLTGSLPAKAHIRRQGEEFGAGEIVLHSGSVITPRMMVALAACDVSEAEVWRRARLSVIATGNELAEPGKARASRNGIPDSVSEALLLLARQWGAKPQTSIRIGDDFAELHDEARAAIEASDIVAVIGGASAGKRDLAKDAFMEAGTELAWSGVAMKPGKPAWFGKAGSTYVLGLPGNPTAAMTIARLFMAPLMTVLGGGEKASALCWSHMPIAEDFEYRSDRLGFLTARLCDGQLTIEQDQRSSGQIRLLTSDGLVRIEPHSGCISAGTGVPFLAW